MFNFRPDTPWIRFRPEPAGDDPPGFRIAPDGSVMDTRSGADGSGWSGSSPNVFGASSAAVAYGPFETAIDPRSHPADSSFAFASTPRRSMQEAFDQLSRIYAGAGFLKPASFGSQLHCRR